jgi:membrane protein DedA with SNARE-associated domain
MNDETLEKEKSRRVVTGALLLLLLAALAAAYAAGNSAAGGQLIAGAADIAALRGLDAGTISPAAIFLIFAAATLISEDLACISAGVLAAQGRIGLALAISSCAVGILAGDLLLFAAGRFFGRPALQSRFVRHFISENAFEKSSRWLEREGLKTVFISRFVFGLRLPLYFAAGVLKTSFWRFALYFSLAVTIWTPLVVGLAYLLGAEIAGEALSAQYFWLGLPALAAGLYLALRLAMRLATWKGRRLLWGKIKRRLIWEFWSIRVFYLPVVVYIVYLGVRFRDLTVFTCANPAIMAGGFAGESKDRIFSGLQASEAARPHLLAHLLITSKLTAEARLAAAEDFITARDLAFPIVLKPDVGERGAGVRIVASKEDLAARLRAAKEDLILQQHAPGEEVSVFYVRRPAAEKGEIFAITEKLFPHVAGVARDARRIDSARPARGLSRRKLSRTQRRPARDGARGRRARDDRRHRNAFARRGLSRRRPAQNRRARRDDRSNLPRLRGFLFRPLRHPHGIARRLQAWAKLQDRRIKRCDLGSDEHLRPAVLVVRRLPNPLQTMANRLRDRPGKQKTRRAPDIGP